VTGDSAGQDHAADIRAADPAAVAPQRIDPRRKAAADAAKGFLPEPEAQALWDAAWAMAPYGVLLEIGTYCGKSATWLGAAALASAGESRGRVVTVDHHRGSEENQPGWEHHDPSLVDPDVGLMDTLPWFRHTVHAAGLEDVVTAVVGRSTTVASLWALPLAMLFIDGGHAEEHARNDYTHWTPHLVPAGVLAIHDVFPDPADGGQAPFHVYQQALADGFTEVRHEGSLRILRAPTASPSR
jgi:predicted O-methyltransferase YrrM